MSVKVRIPTPLRKLSGDKSEVHVDGNSLGEVLSTLDTQYPGFRARICDDSGEIRRFVNVYINGDDVRFLQGVNTALKSGDEVSIVPAMAGGA